MEVFLIIIKMIVVLVIVLCLIFITFKLGESKLNKMQNGKYIKVIERMQITKNNTIILLKIGDLGYVISLSNDKSEILKEISKEELLAIEKGKIDIRKDMFIDINNIGLEIKEKLKSLRMKR